MSASDIVEIALLADSDQVDIENFLNETIGSAVIDCGCSASVCGELWLKAYLDSLSCKEKSEVKYYSSSRLFRFGDGNKVKAINNVVIPLHIGCKKTSISVDVVSQHIPLLFSKSSLAKAKAVINFEKSEINILGQNIPLRETTSGHLLLGLKRELDPCEPYARRILVASKFDANNPAENKKKIVKVHRQFAHPPARRLKKFLADAGVEDDSLLDMVEAVTDQCETCKKLKKPPSKPVVGFPLAKTFNEVVAMDLKVYSPGVYFLHLIDHATRYSQAVVIHNKRK